MSVRWPLLPLGKKAPYVLGGVAITLLVYGLVRDADGLVLVGAVASAALFVGYPLAEFLLGRESDEHGG